VKASHCRLRLDLSRNLKVAMNQFQNGWTVSLSYTSQDIQGVVILIVVSFISLLAVVVLLSVIFLSAYNTRDSVDESLFVRTHAASYFVSLLLCNFMQAIASIINIAWVDNKGIYFGETCVVQGVLKQTSDVGTALWTLVIAVHTFCLIFLEIQARPFILWTTLLGGWSTIVTIVLFGPATVNREEKGPFFAISGYWCWISPNYPTERITLNYLFMFLTAFTSFVLYILIFLKLRGNLVRVGWRVYFRRSIGAGSTICTSRKILDDQGLRVAKQMLLYPVVYSILVFPIASARFASWAGNHVPFEVTIFTASIFLLSGLVNVVLFTSTRRMLPADSMKIGKWPLWPPREPPADREGHGIHNRTISNPIPIPDNVPISRSPGHSRSGSQSSTETVVAEDYSSKKFPRTGKPRPPSISIRRDSIESFYSVYDDDEAIPELHQQRHLEPPPTSKWSPDGSPQRRSSHR